MAFASLAVSAPLRAEEAIAVDHAPEPLIIKVYQVADLIVPLASTDAGSGKAEFDWLMDLIELRTGADCWTHGGGHGSINPHDSTMSLVIRQTYAMHEHIADLLSEIRGTGDLALCVEIQLIHGNLEACGDAKPHRTAQGLVDASGKERLLQSLKSQEDGEVLVAPKITFFNGTTASVETTTDGCTKAFNIRGVISKDNRYSRLWVDAKVDGQTTKAEVLVPEGHTAVRKLPGENSWLLVTSHVINAEEPQVIAPLKSEPWTPVEQKKRYLVPVDESPEPTELTGIPQFKAQAEGFGLAVQRTKGAAEAVEKAAAAVDAQPELASAVDRVEYQVAQAEPRHLAGFEIGPPPPAFAFVDLDEVHSVPRRGHSTGDDRSMTEEEKPASTFEMYPRNHSQPKGRIVNSGFRFYQPVEQEMPYRLWIGDILEQDEGVAHGFDIAPLGNDPPARLNVCLDDTDCQSGSKVTAPVGQLFDRIFVTAVPAPVIPGPVVTDGDLVPNGWNTRPSFTITHFERGRRAIPPTPKPQASPGASSRELSFFPNPQLARVQQASGVEESVATLDDHLKSAQVALENLGLDSEARKLQAIRQTIQHRAKERCQVIDHEIARLKLARERLEKLANPQASGEAEGRSIVR
jgi:hypothetical protein